MYPTDSLLSEWVNKTTQVASSSRPTLWQLCSQGGGDGDEAASSAAVVDGHLLALPEVPGVTVALVAELVEGEAAVHEHSWIGGLHLAPCGGPAPGGGQEPRV